MNIIDIDECKIGRRKYDNCGGAGFWDDQQKSDNTKITSEIHTDCWKGYNGLMAAGGFVAHLTMNQSYHFFDLDTGVRTNMTELQRQSFCQRLIRGGIWQNKVNVHNCKYLWRTDCECRNADPF